ncbi:hypothetical protein [Spiribacter roseus]|uniref:hypothetical protein n=1 Tax=Spiribacter roseus TaxID=1855875 RepID=UPI00132FD949|nr:hypothetical protein [Spiribacter roseus]
MGFKKKLTILIDSPGQLCNQIWSYAPFIARSKRDGSNLIICGFQQYKDLFPRLLEESHVSFCPPSLNLLADLANKNLFYKIIEIVGLSRAHSLALVKSWDSENAAIDSIDKKYIREIFELPYFKRKDDVKRVGIHIRHGDYERWRDGRYFFTFETMALKALEAAKKIFPHTAVEFAVASNVPAHQMSRHISNLKYNPKHSVTQDLGLLASCDLIVGPPSTFSMWASFYGSVPLVYLLGADQVMPSTLPPYIVAQNKFSDGSRMRSSMHGDFNIRTD